MKKRLGTTDLSCGSLFFNIFLIELIILHFLKKGHLALFYNLNETDYQKHAMISLQGMADKIK